jgi:hypothetical protein
MIKNSALEDRLNSFKNGQNIPIQDNIPEKSSVINNDTQDKPSWYNPALYLVETFLFMFKSLVYGYSLKILCSMSWDIISLFCIGLSINFILESINNIFHK